MAPADPVSDASSARELDLPEIIFSCGICQKTPSEVYASPENNKGFHSGSGDDDGMVTRLWLSECMHVSCGRHLPGGAAPFHPHGQQPQAACPQCMRDRGDDSPKDLFGIRGFGAGEHDAAIPEAWFRCPPVKIEGADPGMDALRFQYVALTKYAQKVQRRWKDAAQKYSSSEQSYAKERKRRKQIEAELQQVASDAAANAAAHKKSEAQLKKWRDRQPVINHYLGIVKVMADDMAQMRAQLVELGYHVKPRDYQFKGAVGKDQQQPENQQKAAAAISSSSTAVADQMELSSTSYRKRKHADRDQHMEYQRLNGPGKQRTTSQEMMPPPFLKPTPALLQTGFARSGLFSQAPQTASQRDADDSVMVDRSGMVSESPFQPRAAISRSQDVPTSRNVLPFRQVPANAQQHRTGSLDAFRFQSAAPRPRVHAQDSQGDPQGYLGQHRSGAFASQERSNPFASDHINGARPESWFGSRQSTLVSPWVSQPRDSFQAFTKAQSRVQPTEQHNPFGSGSTSPLKPAQASAPSVISPFFKRDALASRADESRKLASPGDVYGQGTRSQATSYYGTQQPQHHQRESSQIMPQSRMTAYSQRPASYMSQTPRRAQPASTPITFQQRLQSAIPPTQDTKQPVARARLFAPFMSSSQQPSVSKPQSNFARSRISLPPSTSRTQDVELATDPGIRGDYTQRDTNGHAQPGRSYQDSRPLFSAVGRRSVRR